MKKIHVVNYHITNRCNYNCTYCFGKFDGQKEPSLEDAKSIIDNIAECFARNDIVDGRINFAGGEPTLYKQLDDVIDYTNSHDVSVSIVTNASLLTPERIRSWEGKVSCIGISIDSLLTNTNIKIGRSSCNRVITLENLAKLSDAMHECNIDLKINTVVSKLNVDEDLSPLYKTLKPRKIKLFQMHLVDGINDKAKPLKISESEFEAFCNRHKAFQSIIVTEPSGSMENSYLMINPEGVCQLNNHGTYQPFGSLKSTSLFEILKEVPMDCKKFESRYIKEVRI